MALDHSSQREIMRSDAARRARRQEIEDAALGIGVTDLASDAYKISKNTVRGAFVQPCLVKGVGTVTTRTVRASERWKGSLGSFARMRSTTVGIATDEIPENMQGIPTCTVIHPHGRREVVTVRSLRQ